MESLSAAPPGANTQTGPSLLTLPFGGLGLDLTEVRRKVRGLVLLPFAKREAPKAEPRPEAPPAPSGYGLLLRLSRETLGS
jgi:hypothetical protein